MTIGHQSDFGPGSIRLLTLFVFHSTGLLFAHTAAGPLGLALAAVILPFGLWLWVGRIAQKGLLASRSDLDRALSSALASYAAGQTDAGFFILQVGETGSEAKVTRKTILALQDVLRDGDVCTALEHGRIGICAPSLRRFDTEGGQHIAQRLQHAAKKVFQTSEVFVGLCLASRSPGECAQGMAAGANRALEEAIARASTGVCAYSKRLGGAELDGDLIRQVKDALANGDIRPVFQPQVDVQRKTVIGAEALARWYHPTRGTIPPMEFLAAVKSAGQWGAMTDLMLTSALLQLAAWDAAGLDVGCMGVNFSETDLAHPQIVQRVEWALDAANLSPDRLAVEVLETVAADPDQAIFGNVQSLADLGCRIDIDDFGTGHAAISTLRGFPAHRIKVDRSFISGIDQSPQQQDMLETIILMADRLGLETLAEGVENDAEQATVVTLSCTQMQGYGIARPMPADQFEAWYYRTLPQKSQNDAIKVA